MPFKSRSQARKFFAMESRHELPKGTAERWAHETKDIKALPEHKGKKGKNKGHNKKSYALPSTASLLGELQPSDVAKFLNKLAALPNAAGPLQGAPKLPSLGSQSMQAPKTNPAQATPTTQAPQATLTPNTPGWNFGKGVVAPQIMMPQGGVQAVQAQNRLKVSRVLRELGLYKQSMEPDAVVKPSVLGNNGQYNALLFREQTPNVQSSQGAAGLVGQASGGLSSALGGLQSVQEPRSLPGMPASVVKPLTNPQRPQVPFAPKGYTPPLKTKPAPYNLNKPVQPKMLPFTGAIPQPDSKVPSVQGMEVEPGVVSAPKAPTAPKLASTNKESVLHALGDPYPSDWNGRFKHVRGDLHGLDAWNSLSDVNSRPSSASFRPIDHGEATRDHDKRTGRSKYASELARDLAELPLSNKKAQLSSSKEDMPAEFLRVPGAGEQEQAHKEAQSFNKLSSSKEEQQKSFNKLSSSKEEMPATFLRAQSAPEQVRALAKEARHLASKEALRSISKEEMPASSLFAEGERRQVRAHNKTACAPEYFVNLKASSNRSFAPFQTFGACQNGSQCIQMSNFQGLSPSVGRVRQEILLKSGSVRTLKIANEVMGYEGGSGSSPLSSSNSGSQGGLDGNLASQNMGANLMGAAGSLAMEPNSKSYIGNGGTQLGGGGTEMGSSLPISSPVSSFMSGGSNSPSTGLMSPQIASTGQLGDQAGLNMAQSVSQSMSQNSPDMMTAKMGHTLSRIRSLAMEPNSKSYTEYEVLHKSATTPTATLSSSGPKAPTVSGAVQGGLTGGRMGGSQSANNGATGAKPVGTTTGGASPAGMSGGMPGQQGVSGMQPGQMPGAGAFTGMSVPQASFVHRQNPPPQSKGTYMPKASSTSSSAELDVVGRLEKSSFLDVAALGAGIGAYRAPKGHKWEGAGRGASIGMHTGMGMMGGAGLGGILGGAAGGPAGLVAGLGAGMAAGGYGGYRLGKHSVGTPSWEKKPEDHKDKKTKKPKHESGSEHKKASVIEKAALEALVR